MKLSFCTLGCPDWDLDTIAARGRDLGFDGVELRGTAGEHIGPDETPEARAEFRRRFADADLEIACIMGYSSFTSPDDEARAESIRVAGRFLEVARDVGCPTLRVFGGVFGELSRDEAVDRVVDGIRQLTPKAEELGVRIALETHDDWCIGENIRAVVDGVASEAFGICWDVSNAFFTEPMEETFAAIRDRIYHVHFKDAVRTDEGKVQSVLPGTGGVDMAGALQLMIDAGYDGWLSFEWEKKWEPELPDPDIAFPHYVKHAAGLMEDCGLSRD